MTTERSEAAFARAARLMPGGVSSPVRAFGAVGGTPRFVRRASGARVWDVDGNELIDLVGSWGAMIAGHAHPAVVEAVERAARDGTSFGMPCEAEAALAAEIADRMPSVERARFVSSGTEAVMSAVRLARAATGREVIVKLEGCYHGHADGLLAKAGSGLATFGLPGSPGVPAEASRHTITLPFGDVGAMAEVFERHGASIAAVVLEPIAGNMGLVPPPEGYLESVRTLTADHGALLVFDEVMTGLRVSRGGAQELFGVAPDLTTLGKVIGGGLPVGAYGGRADLMSLVAPEGPVYQAGTLSGNPLGMAAGLATLSLLDAAAYDRLERAGRALEEGLRGALESEWEGPVAVQRVGSMLTAFFGADQVRDFAGASAADHAAFGRFFHAMLGRGVHLPPSGYEAWFLSLAHGPGEIETIIEAARSSARSLREGAPSPTAERTEA